MVHTLLICSCTTIQKFNYKVDKQKHSPSALRTDLDFIYRNLQEKHPGIYWYVSKEALDKKVDSLKNSLTDPLNSKEFFKKAAPIVSAINCGHTRLLLVNKKLTKFEKDSIEKVGIKPIRQFTYVVKNNRLFIRSNKSTDSTLMPGTEILTINDVSSSDIIQQLTTFIPSDGYNRTFKYETLNRNFSTWYAAIFSDPDSLNFYFLKNTQSYRSAIRSKITKKQEVIVKPISDAERKQRKEQQLAQKRLRYRGLDENKKPLLAYRIIDSVTKTAILSVRSFSFPNADFDKFYKETFNQVQKNGINNLILDLRNNGGGSLRASRNLFGYLTDREFTYLQKADANGRFVITNGSLPDILLYPTTWIANQLLIRKDNNGYYAALKGMNPLKPNVDNYKGKLFVLLNGSSFSAATLLASNLKAINRATFVGVESGGGENQCTAGRIPVLDLPNTGLKLRMGLFKIAPNFKTNIVGRGIFPDVEVSASLEDELKKVDPELDLIVKTIKKGT